MAEEPPACHKRSAREEREADGPIIEVSGACRLSPLIPIQCSVFDSCGINLGGNPFYLLIYIPSFSSIFTWEQVDLIHVCHFSPMSLGGIDRLSFKGYNPILSIPSDRHQRKGNKNDKALSKMSIFKRQIVTVLSTSLY